MQIQAKSCPRCHGTVYLDQGFDNQRGFEDEWVCLHCGWRCIARRSPRPRIGARRSGRSEHIRPLG